MVPGGIVLHGGFNGVEHLGDTWLLDPATFLWRQLHKASAAPPSSNHCLLLLHHSTLLRIGGEASSHASTSLAPPIVIDAAADGSWALQPITGAPLQPLSGCSAGWLPAPDGTTRLCLFGGWGAGAAACQCVVVDTATWTCCEAAVKSAAHVEVGRLGSGALQQAEAGALLFGGWDGMFQWMNTVLALSLF